MTILLRQPSNLPPSDRYDQWLAIGGIDPSVLDLPATRMMPNAAGALEHAFEDCRELWWSIGRVLAGQPTAEISHAAACASFGSDFGLMLAWDHLVRSASADRTVTLAVCDDPHLFRHLSEIPGVDAGRRPGVRVRCLLSGARGLVARVSVGLRVAWAALACRNDRAVCTPGAPALIVYGHPGSRADGYDIYFGDLLARFPDVWRVLHTDCGLKSARELTGGERTVSLHAWGNPLYAIFGLPWMRWRPVPGGPLCREYAWLIRRSAVVENSGGGPAINRWQQHCQARWLDAARPRAVAWPWENFSWERALVRAARAKGVVTTGYQHTVIGPHQFNYSVNCNPDGSASVPDKIAADGPAYRQEMIDWGLAEERVVDGGSFRITEPTRHMSPAADAPVYMALSANLKIANRQMDIARRIAGGGMKVVIKQHPMYPVSFAETENLSRTETSMAEFRKLSCVIYCTGASALDALLAGLPSVRLRFADQVSIDVLPKNIGGAVADTDGIFDFVNNPAKPPEIVWRDMFSPVDYGIWASLLKTTVDLRP
ncbi:MAG: hypothetical protein CMM16_01210 [Rhodospirillaceae bacterium]|nr:hypothetical protein [Rhodospirillaceae bacterium]